MVKIDADLRPQELALLECAVLMGLNAVGNTAGSKAGQIAAVVALGGGGLMAV
ncbi:hypothetical protein [Sphingomonas phyllosphaerae]|uniref:hypothetical protein n=1 Tax=Sphingomonas phyllosphaerae TaxID=257003 RepID=UPI0012DF658C|nr:hypothetical protein [Sphingomonas phyllosphaerae]